MNKAILIIIGAVIVVGIGVFVVFELIAPPATPQTSTNGPIGSTNQAGGNTTQVTAPEKPASTLPFPVATVDGGFVQTKDFKNDPDAGQYPTAGYYFIGFHTPVQGTSNANATDKPPYTITYIDSTQYFNISVLQEPIASTRQQAEQYLMEHLGIPQEQMCRLKYMLAVPQSVNDFYSGQNLGFSFCPGAVQL